MLGEFSDVKHNQLPEPDRAVNNTTYWVPDFSRTHYMNLLFDDTAGANSMRNYYKEQSSNRYAVYGDVTDWVGVPGAAASYDDNPDSNVWNFLQDSVDSWYDAQIAAGKTPAEIDAYLAQYDKLDRFDYDYDGNFDEPDGYIDTFQSVHAGLGEEEGGAPWTIWSHSWYAHYELEGIAGPSFNKLGGIQIGDSDIWVGKYTIQPEDGGVGVFAHEFGHDLGLPDIYDYYGENGTGFWTLMSSGSWIDEGKDTIGNKPSHMGMWEKFQLGWLNYEEHARREVPAHRRPDGVQLQAGPRRLRDPAQEASDYDDLGPVRRELLLLQRSWRQPQQQDVQDCHARAGLPAQRQGELRHRSGLRLRDGSHLDQRRRVVADGPDEPVQLGGGPERYRRVLVGMTDYADLSAYTGNVVLGFGYVTDGGQAEVGFMVDDLNITGYPTDGAETDAGWAMSGFRVTTGTESRLYSQYYTLENRTYMGYDYGLKVGPYFFGYLNDPNKQDWVDHFAYQDGLLINLWDTSQRDNNTGLHPGQGLLLPVDAHPKTLFASTG